MKRLTLLAGCLILFCAPLSTSLAQERMLTKAAAITTTLPEPLKITSFALKTVASRQNRNVQANSDWLNNPLVEVENISGKTIEYLVIEINFPGAESLSAQSPLLIAYGRVPGRKSLIETAEALQPGAKVKLTVGRNAGEGFKSRLLASDTRLLSGIRAATRINGVVFTDKTAWFDGLLHVADPNNPLRWNVVENSLSRADVNDSPLFTLAKASYSTFPVKASKPELCWKRMGTEWVTCCDGFPVMASAILMQMFGGIYEPHQMSMTCPDGETTCEWIKQVGCSYPPPE